VSGTRRTSHTARRHDGRSISASGGTAASILRERAAYDRHVLDGSPQRDADRGAAEHRERPPVEYDDDCGGTDHRQEAKCRRVPFVERNCRRTS
jgi:hypothetical protein